MAMDYFKVRYPGTPVVFDMSLVYIVVAFVTVLGNNVLVETFRLNSRINFGKIFLSVLSPSISYSTIFIIPPSMVKSTQVTDFRYFSAAFIVVKYETSHRFSVLKSKR